MMLLLLLLLLFLFQTRPDTRVSLVLVNMVVVLEQPPTTCTLTTSRFHATEIFHDTE
jgi:hypothetical protein